MKTIYTLSFILFGIGVNLAQITLTHSVGNNPIQTSIYGCNDTGLRWSRVFVLEDFGIENEFALRSGFTALRVSDATGIGYRYNVYEVDENFPNSFDESNILGSSQMQIVPFSSSNIVISNLEFEEPIIIPEGIERILVEIKQEIGDVVFMAGTSQDNDFSWFKSDALGCDPSEYTTTDDLNRPDARFYINVTGEELLSIEDNTKVKLKLYPVPSQDFIEIDGIESYPLAEIRIYDIKGQLLSSFKDQSKINISEYDVGIYFLSILDVDGNSQTERFIKI